MARINLGKVVPDKGVDYFTNADKTEIQGMVETQIAPTLAEKELLSHKVTSIGDSSTDTEYPSAKATYDLLQAKDALIAELEEQNEIILNQIPTATATGETINVNDSSNLPIKNFEMIGNTTQDGEATPETPQAIHVVTGDNTVKVTGKNIFSGEIYWANSGISDTGERTTNTNYDVYKIQVRPNVLYTMQENVVTTTSVVRVRSFDVNGTFLRREFYKSRSTTGYDAQTFTTDSSASYILVQFRKTDTDLQIEQGSATTYEPYQEQSITLPLGDIELAGIGNYKDYIYKNSTDNKWYKVANIGKDIYTNESNFSTQGPSHTTILNLYRNLGATAQKNAQIYSNIISYNASAGANNDSIGNIGKTNGSGGSILIDVLRSEFADSTAFKTFLGTTNMIVYYPLVTPTTTEITDTALITALEEVLAMTTYKTTTNAFTLMVSDNATPTLQVEYRQDIETLINNLDARLSLLE